MSNERISSMRRRLAEYLGLAGRPVSFMEVCGTHTVSIFRSGLRSLLPEGLRLLSGPGCPVCVTDRSEIDAAVALAEKGCAVLTYGDMVRVPGSCGSLREARERGASVEVVTSAMAAAAAARENPNRETVFLGVGFETTAPATAATLKRAFADDIRNLSVLCMHKLVPPVMRALCSRPDLKIDGFILPGNVTVVAGESGYAFLTDELRKAAAVAGFEPEEILAALVDLARQVAEGEYRIGAYRTREVPRTGNPTALRLMSEVFEPCDARWRGFGVIPGSGLRLRGDYYPRFDARERFGLEAAGETGDGDACRCGEILSGLLTPPECELYGTACTPANPVGPCMVSSEGTCGAWHRFNPPPWSASGTEAAGV